MLAAAPAPLWLLPCWVGTFCRAPGTTAGLEKWKGSPGGAVPRLEELQWPKECGPRVGCDSQRASPSALCAKGDQCKSWTCDALQSFGWWCSSKEKNTDNGNAHHLNNAFANFYPGSSSHFKGKDTLFSSSLSPAAIHDLLWLYNGCMVSSSSISLCSITPDQTPSEMSPSCWVNHPTISCFKFSKVLYKYSQSMIFKNKSSFTCNCLFNQCTKQKFF